MISDNIMVISPGYVDAVLGCMSNYNTFTITGFSNSKFACESLDKIPGNKYLGFSYIGDNLVDIVGLKQLLCKIDLMYDGLVGDNYEDKIPFIFLLSKKLGGKTGTYDYLKSTLTAETYNNIRFGYANFEYLSDKIIKRELFGTLLLNKRDLEAKPAELESVLNTDSSMCFKLPFSGEMLVLFEPLTFVERDEVLASFRNKPLLYALRMYQYTQDRTIYENIQHLIALEDPVNQIIYNTCLMHTVDTAVRHAKQVRKDMT